MYFFLVHVSRVNLSFMFICYLFSVWHILKLLSHDSWPMKRIFSLEEIFTVEIVFCVLWIVVRKFNLPKQQMIFQSVHVKLLFLLSFVYYILKVFHDFRIKFSLKTHLFIQKIVVIYCKTINN